MALGVMAGLWPLRLRSLHAGFWPCERVMGVKENPVASGEMARSWPFRLRSLHADPCAGERVMGVKENPVASGVMGPVLAIAPKVLTRRSMLRGACYGRKVVRRGLKRDGPVFMRFRSLHADFCAGKHI